MLKVLYCFLCHWVVQHSTSFYILKWCFFFASISVVSSFLLVVNYFCLHGESATWWYLGPGARKQDCQPNFAKPQIKDLHILKFQPQHSYKKTVIIKNKSW